jgi:hypothetical protein
MRVVIGVLLVGVVVWAWLLIRPPQQQTVRSVRSTEQRRQLQWRMVWIASAAVVAVLLWRFGLNWLVVAGSVGVASARRLMPLLRYLPFAKRLYDQRARTKVPPSNGSAPPGSNGGSRHTRSGMSRAEALDILGLPPNASPEDAEREYRRLMKKVHPDAGGSDYLAAKLNQARETLKA